MGRNLLICPLYWGTGHATRMAALAEILNKKGFRLYVAAPLPLLRVFDELPAEITRIELGSYRPRYPSWINLSVALLFQSPLMLWQYISDRVRTGKITRKFNINIILSDNRFGCHNRNAHSIYITHQLNIRSPFRKGSGSIILSYIHRLIIKHYDECWIPDLPGKLNLSGLLSHPARPGIPYRFIGILSHLAKVNPELPGNLPASPFHLLVLSGPEPMKSHFEKQVVEIYNNRSKPLIIAGSDVTASESILPSCSKNIFRFGYLDPRRLKHLLKNSERVICRPGYSTIMDLVTIGVSALLIPTPGQTEQEYLALSLSERNLFSCQSQDKLEYRDIEHTGNCVNEYEWIEESSALLEDAIDTLSKILP